MVHLFQISVYGLPASTEKQEVEAYFGRVGVKTPVVKDFVKDPRTGELSTIVILTIEKKSAGERALNDLKSVTFDTTSRSKVIGFEYDCLRVIVLARSRQEPSFE